MTNTPLPGTMSTYPLSVSNILIIIKVLVWRFLNNTITKYSGAGDYKSNSFQAFIGICKKNDHVLDMNQFSKQSVSHRLCSLIIK